MTTEGTAGDSAAAAAVMGITAESEQAWSGDCCFGARPRASSGSISLGLLMRLKAGVYAITGGLGGLGLRAAALLLERGASCVVLASRSGQLSKPSPMLSKATGVGEHAAPHGIAWHHVASKWVSMPHRAAPCLTYGKPYYAI